MKQQRTIEELCQHNLSSDKHTVILNVAEFEQQAVQEYCLPQLSKLLLDQDLNKYEKNKEQLDVKFELDLFTSFQTNIYARDYLKAIICSSNQYTRQFSLEQDVTNIEYFQSKNTLLTRGLSTKTDDIITNINEVHEKSYKNRRDVEFLYYESDDPLDLANFARECQKQNRVALIQLKLNIEFDQSKITQQYIINKRKEIKDQFYNKLYNLVYRLQAYDVKLEYVIISQNIASQYLKTFKLLNDIKTYQMNEFVKKLTFLTMKILNQVIPPSIGGVFHTIESDNLRYLLNIINGFNSKVSCMMTYPVGIMLNYKNLTEVFQCMLNLFYQLLDFGGFHRQQSAQILLNQLCELILLSLNGKYKDKEGDFTITGILDGQKQK